MHATDGQTDFDRKTVRKHSQLHGKNKYKPEMMIRRLVCVTSSMHQKKIPKYHKTD